ncbi:hypothetical protein AMEX_G10908 [Astyanax mexicanus]|uniref:Immunoglobulin V-set domain-containing protein n=1 Tax=Astyanax mexicanus TaxID=7994 RepID=A0A8T2LX32_ASTMX|nr:hypothetical protein AMEX_G10908 [Astyanax mexicanus]
MNGLLYLTFLVVIQCGRDVEGSISHTVSAVRVKPGLSTSLSCHIQLHGHFFGLWMKICSDEGPVCIAMVASLRDEVEMYEGFQNHSRIKASWKKKTFHLSFSSVEQTDMATYICGAFSYDRFFWGNGSKLIVARIKLTKSFSFGKLGKIPVSGYLVVALAATNVASMFLIIYLCHLLKKKRSGMTKTDEVNYAALNFGNKQKRTVQKRSNVDNKVVYGAVRH